MSDWRIDFLRHQLRIFGFPESHSRKAELVVFDRASLDDLTGLQARKAPLVVVAILPSNEFMQALGASIERVEPSPAVFSPVDSHPSHTVRTLHPYDCYVLPDGRPLLTDDRGRISWMLLERRGLRILAIGTDLPGDIVRYRQGDPKASREADFGFRWGFDFERPNYLFEAQRSGEARGERHADRWAALFSSVVATTVGATLLPILPGHAPGAIVFTGDDDQAYLERYEEQIACLSGMPITYFLHPQTRHSSKTLRQMRRRANVEWELHPDAVEDPSRYAELLDEQVEWFVKLTGRRPHAVRNHGFLNRGYWEHFAAWRKHGIALSTNVPGFDGTALNGSLLPSRFVWNDEVTDHWTILTAMGDGVLFAGKMTDEDAARRLSEVVSEVRNSSIPGVLVLNLHPQNIDRSRALHAAAVDAVKQGFVPWNVGQCLSWFRSRDAVGRTATRIPLWQRLWTELRF